MKSRHKLSAALLASFILGIGAASILHAQTQTKAPGYVVAEIDVRDQDGYIKDFQPKAIANIKEFGGKYIGGGKAIGFIGAPPPNRVVLLQFPDMDTVKAFEEKEGRNANEVGSKYASFRVIGIEGVAPK